MFTSLFRKQPSRAPKRIFLSSTCIDLKDARADFKSLLEGLGYSVLASEYPDFPVNPGLHNHDNCILTVDIADLYLLIIGDRYGSAYEGTLLPNNPFVPDAGTSRERNAQDDETPPAISVTWHEYLRALEKEKDVLILIRKEIWDQRSVFKAARAVNESLADEAAKILNIPPGLLDFIEFVLAQKRRNWIHTFTDVVEARQLVATQLRARVADDQRAFSQAVAEVLDAAGYRVLSVDDTRIVMENPDPIAAVRVFVRPVFSPGGGIVSDDHVLLSLPPGLEGCERALVVTNTAFNTTHSSDSRITLLRLEDLLRRLIDFTEYARRVSEDYDQYTSERTPRVLPLRVNLKESYIPMNCRGDYEGRLDKCVDEFLADDQVNHLTVLGDFGTGKSSSMIALTAQMLNSGRYDRIPLFFSLRDYVNVDSLQTLVTKAATEAFGCRSFNYAAFLKMLEAGKLLLIFDAFDEMATLSERWASLESLRRLNEAVRGRSKIMLTCRTHYFRDQAAEQEAIAGSLPGTGGELFAEIAGRRNYARVYLLPFTTQQIETFIRQREPERWATHVESIRSLPGLNDLVTRPVLLEMVIKTLPDLIKERSPINAAMLYRRFTDLWLRDVAKGGGTIKREDKRIFSSALAVRLYESGRHRIHHGQLREYIESYFAQRIRSFADLHLLDQEIRTCDFLNRDSQGNYQFAHRSFMEFFVAEELVRRILANEDCAWSLTSTVVKFANDIFAVTYRYPTGCDSPMAFVEGGSFVSGSEEQGNLKVSKVGPFWVDRAPVTNSEYAAFLADRWPGGRCADMLHVHKSRIRFVRGYSVEPGYEEHPVTGVTWHGACAYAEWTNRRLPTSVEWEKAARGIDGRTYPWGEHFDSCFCNTRESGSQDTTSVEAHLAGLSPFGCADMAGNVWEWTMSPLVQQSESFVIRGGAWDRPRSAATCAATGSEMAVGAGQDIGFRCAKDSDAPDRASES